MPGRNWVGSGAAESLKIIMRSLSWCVSWQKFLCQISAVQCYNTPGDICILLSRICLFLWWLALLSQHVEGPAFGSAAGGILVPVSCSPVIYTLHILCVFLFPRPPSAPLFWSSCSPRLLSASSRRMLLDSCPSPERARGLSCTTELSLHSSPLLWKQQHTAEVCKVLWYHLTR